MRIKKMTEVSLEDILISPIQAAICASGYEERARYIAETLAKTPVEKVALGFEAHRDVGDRPKNDAAYEKLSYDCIVAPGNSGDCMREIVKNRMSKLPSQSVIVVDITSMTRYWYGTFLNELKKLHRPIGTELSVFFTYVPSKYEKPPQDQPPNVSVGPVAGFSAVELPELPTAVILGLGHEPGKALGITDYIDAGELFAFLTKPALDKRFVRDVRKMNGQLLEKLAEGHLIEYPLGNITRTGLLLNSLAEGLLRSYRVILVPLGPKIFSLMCFLFALRHPEVSVWRVSAEEEEFLAKRPPRKPILACRVDFVEAAS